MKPVPSQNEVDQKKKMKEDQKRGTSDFKNTEKGTNVPEKDDETSNPYHDFEMDINENEIDEDTKH